MKNVIRTTLLSLPLFLILGCSSGSQPEELKMDTTVTRQTINKDSMLIEEPAIKEQKIDTVTREKELK